MIISCYFITASIPLFMCASTACMWWCVKVGISSPTQAGHTRPEWTLVVRSTGTCSKQMFATPLSVFVFFCIQHSCVSLLQYPRCMHICVCLHFTIQAPIQYVQRHSDPLCDFCHFKHPLLQCSVTEHLLYSNVLMSEPPERGEMRSRRRRISWVFIFSLEVPPVLC